jgi:peptidoglycan/xylan/chitin deacetylase (PgdA/CDA1 family)
MLHISFAPLLRELRHVSCSALALLIIAFGATRRARRKILGSDVVSAIYFHCPRRQLLEHCIDWLIGHGYVFVSAADVFEFLTRGVSLPRGAVWLSFDDGNRMLRELISEILERRGIPITLFIASDLVTSRGWFPWSEPDRRVKPVAAGSPDGDCLTEEEVKNAALSAVVTIGSHTVHHAITTTCADEQLCYELGECKRVLELWTNRPVQYFAYPGGEFDGRERRYLKEFQYRLAATTQSALVARGGDPYLVPRFSVANDIYFPEALCNMVGVWRPLADPIKALLRRGAGCLSKLALRSLRRKPANPEADDHDNGSYIQFVD